jgi:hypothetical protein
VVALSIQRKDGQQRSVIVFCGVSIQWDFTVSEPKLFTNGWNLSKDGGRVLIVGVWLAFDCEVC